MNSKARTNKRIAAQVENQLQQLIATVRKRDSEGNYVDCEVIVKATILVVNGHTAAEALSLAKG